MARLEDAKEFNTRSIRQSTARNVSIELLFAFGRSIELSSLKTGATRTTGL